MCVLTLVTSSFFTSLARLAELEMLLTLCVFTSTLWYFEYVAHGRRCHLYGAYAMLGLAFMTKEAVPLLFFVPPILCYGLLARSKPALQGLIDWRGWLLFSAIAFPWYIYVNTQLQGAPLLGVLAKEMSTKIAGEKSEPFYFYLRSVAVGFAPWILILLWQPRTQFKKLFATEAGRFFGLAALVPLIILSLFTFKRDKYILPLYPALAVWLGLDLAYWLQQAKLRRRPAAVALTAFSALLIALFVGYYALIQAHVKTYRYDAYRPLAARLDTMRGVAPVYFFKTVSIQLVYYYGRPIRVVQKAELEKMLADGKSFLLLAKDERVNNAKGPGICMLEQIRPYGDTNRVMYVLAGGSLCRPPAPSVPSSVGR